MLVISMPRSGGTKYCMDLSEQLDMPYVGDMNPMNIQEFGATWAKIKQTHHETDHDQSISMDDYLGVIEDMSECIVLCNNQNFMMLPRADKFFLRKNFGNSIRSLANYWLKISPGIDDTILLQTVIIPTIMHGKLVYEYIKRNECDVTWYEDYFNDKPCITPLLDNNIRLKEMVEALCELHEI